jgi:hypothetical protein
MYADLHNTRSTHHWRDRHAAHQGPLQHRRADCGDHRVLQGQRPTSAGVHAARRLRLEGPRVITAENYLVAPITITARGKTNGASITIENLWLFEVHDGNFTRAQIDADTAAAAGNVAG